MALDYQGLNNAHERHSLLLLESAFFPIDRHLKRPIENLFRTTFSAWNKDKAKK
jgi:hypothetical protein